MTDLVDYISMTCEGFIRALTVNRPLLMLEAKRERRGRRRKREPEAEEAPVELPVELTEEELKKYKEQGFVVSETPDGLRVVVATEPPIVFFIPKHIPVKRADIEKVLRRLAEKYRQGELGKDEFRRKVALLALTGIASDYVRSIARRIAREAERMGMTISEVDVLTDPEAIKMALRWYVHWTYRYSPGSLETLIKSLEESGDPVKQEYARILRELVAEVKAKAEAIYPWFPGKYIAKTIDRIINLLGPSRKEFGEMIEADIKEYLMQLEAQTLHED